MALAHARKSKVRSVTPKPPPTRKRPRTLLVSATQFKVGLGRFMEAARRGETVTVTDRGRAIAQLVPLLGPDDTLIWDNVPDLSESFGALAIRGTVYRGEDSTSLLRADRDR
jgi:prevent-host-death family protein